MGANQTYANQYAEYAMEQMRRYGIPASVTLAQGILESSNGKSQLAQECNNHFGIKATNQWLKNGGAYGVYTDDRPNEKFCKYDSVADSYEHHSKFLKENSRYSRLFTLSPDDYKGWAKGIEKAGYASGGNYAANVQKIIEINGLDKYDKQVMAEMKAQGKTFGTEQNPRESAGREQGAKATADIKYSFPLKREEFLYVTSDFGKRKDPIAESKTVDHKGLDIRCNNEPLLATEDKGKVVAVNENAQAKSGKSVTIEYERENGNKVQCTYMHMDSVNVKVGDTVEAGQQVGISGNSGRSTGPHVHFEVKAVTEGGQERIINPSAYLADIAQKGDINLQVMYQGKDLLADYQTAESQTQNQGQTEGKAGGIDTSLSPDEWMKKLLSSEDSGVGMGGNDPIIEMLVTTFMAMMSLATQYDQQNKQARMEAVQKAAETKIITLVSLAPNLKRCDLDISSGRPVLHVDTGKMTFSHELTANEMTSISQTLGNDKLTDEQKQQRIGGIINNLVNSQQLSQNFQQSMEQQQSIEQSQTESMQRK